jgi:hypothetical protein
LGSQKVRREGAPPVVEQWRATPARSVELWKEAITVVGIELKVRECECYTG